MQRLRVLANRLTIILLVASVCLLLPGLAGIGASVLLTVILAGGGLAFATVRNELDAVPTFLGYRLDRHVPDIWLSLFIAATVLLAFPGATAPELQALGGMVGLVGMTNYFLSPVYLYLIAQVRRLGG